MEEEKFNLKPPFDSVEMRLSIEELTSKECYKIQRDLFLQDFARVQQNDFLNNHDSFYAVAGIHGIPGHYSKSLVDEYPKCSSKEDYKKELPKIRINTLQESDEDGSVEEVPITIQNPLCADYIKLSPHDTL
ncbi:hypothetical protein RCL_jg4868.t1 [Rhizophagus clarus]|uniref:Uncharacterized protein n=1 Tax=Rhizophagus clarus TaxID=94130 RepID=A0A8H3R679_9GLOM|nr:hypothetical protein RCL_jg4868.t1 [Rhizophagus clarus]